MATKYVNAQISGSASGTSAYQSLYNTATGSASSTAAVISSIVVTNTANASKLYRIAIMDAPEGPPANKNWIVYDATIAANDTVALTLGLTLGVSQYLRVSSTDANVTFSAYLSEIST